MIALDTNVLVRYLVEDDAAQVKTVRNLMRQLTPEQPGFVCREVTVELVWVLQKAYGFSREQIAEVLDALIASKGIKFEATDEVAYSILHYRRGAADFSDLMIVAAAKRTQAFPLYTLDRKMSRVEGAALLTEETLPSVGRRLGLTH